MYKFIVDGRWMTNDTEPTGIDHGFVNNVYTAPPKPPLPEPQPALAPSSYQNGSEVEPAHVEKVPGHADKPVENGSALGELREAPIPAAEPTPEKSFTLPDEVKAPVTSTIEVVHAVVAQVTPDPQEVEKASDEVRLKPIHQKSYAYIHDSLHRSRQIKFPKSPSTLLSLLQRNPILSRSTQRTFRCIVMRTSLLSQRSKNRPLCPCPNRS
jgi:hypothetical protein